MSAVPPNLVGPLLQSQLVQRQVSSVRDGEEAGRVNASRQQAAAVDQKDTIVGTTDSDTQVHADAEGAGGQGRAFTAPEEQDPSTPEAAGASVVVGDEGQHIDLRA